MVLEISAGLSAALWLSVPVLAPIVAWVLHVRKTKADPNSDIAEGVTQMRKMREALAPRPAQPSAGDDDQQ